MTNPTILLSHEGAPMCVIGSEDELRELLAEVNLDEAQSYQVWHVFSHGQGAAQDITDDFADRWSDAFDFGDGDDADEILRPFPEFVLSFRRDELLQAYRDAQDAENHRALESQKSNFI